MRLFRASVEEGRTGVVEWEEPRHPGPFPSVAGRLYPTFSHLATQFVSEPHLRVQRRHSAAQRASARAADAGGSSSLSRRMSRRLRLSLVLAAVAVVVVVVAVVASSALSGSGTGS